MSNKTKFIAGLVAVVVIAGWFAFKPQHNIGAIPQNVIDNPVSSYSSIASASSKALVQNGASQVKSVYVANESNKTVWFTLYNDNSLTGWAGKSKKFVVEIPPASATASPSYVLVPSDVLHNFDFTTGIVWSMSPASAYASSSAQPSKYLVNILYY